MSSISQILQGVALGTKDVDIWEMLEKRKNR